MRIPPSGWRLIYAFCSFHPPRKRTFSRHVCHLAGDGLFCAFWCTKSRLMCVPFEIKNFLELKCP